MAYRILMQLAFTMSQVCANCWAKHRAPSRHSQSTEGDKCTDYQIVGEGQAERTGQDVMAPWKSLGLSSFGGQGNLMSNY